MRLRHEDTEGEATVVLALKALTEAVEPSSKTVEVAVVSKAGGLEILEDDKVEALLKRIEEEKAAAAPPPRA